MEWGRSYNKQVIYEKNKVNFKKKLKIREKHENKGMRQREDK